MSISLQDKVGCPVIEASVSSYVKKFHMRPYMVTKGCVWNKTFLLVSTVWKIMFQYTSNARDRKQRLVMLGHINLLCITVTPESVFT